MDLGNAPRSGNVRDMRGTAIRAGGGLGIGGVLFAVAYLLLGGDPGALIQNMEQTAPSQQVGTPEDQAQVEFVSRVLGSTEAVWPAVLQAQGVRYVPPQLALFDGRVSSACGTGSTAMGPFYCPGDQTVYLDLSFFRELERRFQAPGDFAAAYVIGHEVGHHVQRLLGTLERQSRSRDANEESVRTELQADCFAGVWAQHASQTGYIVGLTQADIADGLDAAAAVGDDRIQSETQGQVNPETWTHGSSAQRQKWFTLGYRTGKPAACNTFDGPL
jgi:predicted metalloprotease